MKPSLQRNRCAESSVTRYMSTDTHLLLSNSSNAPQSRNASRYRRVASVLLLIFCLSTTIGLVHVVGLLQQVLFQLDEQQMQQPRWNFKLKAQPLYSLEEAWHQEHHDENVANVLIVYSDGPHLSKLAAAVQVGARNILGDKIKSLRMRTLDNASFVDDVLWADAVILGTHVINANVESKMTKFMNHWSFTEDLSNKVGAVFVTSGGLSAGEELTMVNLLHSLMIFRMIIVGGERWTSAFGASAIVGEGPFKPAGQNDPDKRDFPPICYPTDPNSIHVMFKVKAIGLGERVASIAAQLRRARANCAGQEIGQVN